MQINLKTILAATLPALLTAACVQRPHGVLSDSKMVPVIADMELAEAYLKTDMSRDGNPAAREQSLNYILRKHGVKRADFDSTMSWYGRNLDDYRKLYTQVDRELEQRKRKADRGTSSVELASSDLWPYTRHMVITPVSGSDIFEFSVPTSDIKPGERIEWRMRMGHGAAGTLLLGVEYDNGTVDFMTRSLTSNPSVDMILQTDSDRVVQRLFGHVMADRNALPVWADSIYLHTMPLDRQEYYIIHGQKQVRR